MLEQSLDFLYDAAYVHVRMDRSMGTTPVTSSFIPPTATHELHTARLHRHSRRTRSRSHEAGTFTEERKRRKAPARLVYFGRALRSGFSFDVPDLPSKISCVSFARNPCVLAPPVFFPRAHSKDPPRYSTTSRAPELQHLWGWAWRRLEGHAWRTAKKLCLAETSTRERFLPKLGRILFYRASWWMT